MTADFINSSGIANNSANTLQNYLSLITSQYQNNPKYIAWVQTLLQPFADMQDVIDSITYYYDLNTAIGNQLDVIGQWVGISRNLQEPLVGVYCTADVAGLGADTSIVYNPNTDSLDGLVKLSDSLYLLLLKAKIAFNNWNGTIPEAITAMNAIVGQFGYSFEIIDNQNETMSAGLIGGTGVPPVFLQQMLKNGLFNFRPAGVQLHYFWQSTSAPILAADVNNSYFAGADVGAVAFYF